MKKNNVLIIILSILMAFNIGFTAFVFVKNNQDEKQEAVKYILYVGMNDKDTCKQEISKEEIKNTVKETCLKYTNGYTISDALGGWKDENGNSVEENTIVCILEDVDEDAVYKICDDLISQLNQSCILIEKSNVSSEYYYCE